MEKEEVEKRLAEISQQMELKVKETETNFVVETQKLRQDFTDLQIRNKQLEKILEFAGIDPGK